MQTLLQDLRYGVRMLAKKPGFTLVAVLTLALGIGANTAIFSVINTVLLRQLPYRDSDRLAAVWATVPQKDIQKQWISYPIFDDWKNESRSFEQLTAVLIIDTATLTGLEEPERVKAGRVSASLFSLLGSEPILGRAFSSIEEERRESVVVLSYSLWQKLFNASSEAIGQKLEIDHKTAVIVGVMPAGFDFPSRDTKLWLPLTYVEQWPAFLTARQADAFRAVGRLKPGVTVEEAQAEMNLIAGRLSEKYPETDADKAVSVVLLKDELVGSRLKKIIWLLWGAVLVVLLIACANVASLFWASGVARRKEFALRAALGASRWRVLRQLLIECVTLSSLSGVLGLIVASMLMKAIILFGPSDVPGLNRIDLDLRVLAFSFGLSLLTGIVFGLAPALDCSRSDMNVVLKEGSTNPAGSMRSTRMRRALVVTELALAAVLLSGAGLLIGSFLRIQAVDLGFTPDRLLMMRVELPDQYTDASLEPAAFFKQALENVKALPGVEAAGIDSSVFYKNIPNIIIKVEGRPLAPAGQSSDHIISDDYFRVMNIPLLQGRFFSEEDGPDFPPAAIINNAMARAFWPDEDPLGKRFKYGVPGEEPKVWQTVIGIVSDMLPNGPESQVLPQFYLSHRQNRWPVAMDVVVRTATDPLLQAESVRDRIRSVNKIVPRFEIATVEESLRELGSERRFQTWLWGLFAALALLLSAVGLYGVLAYLVTQRRHEIGIRMALGARPRDVFRLVIRQGATLALIGITIGLMASFVLMRLIESLLYGVSSSDPATFAIISSLLMIVALTACAVPAHRATKLDPMVALRHE